MTFRSTKRDESEFPIHAPLASRGAAGAAAVPQADLDEGGVIRKCFEDKSAYVPPPLGCLPEPQPSRLHEGSSTDFLQ